MKKKLALLMTFIILTLSLFGCGSTYQESIEPNDNTVGKGYFTTVEEWGSNMTYTYHVVYANDTKAMYFIIKGGQGVGITPLYNADGTLQIYNGE